ncbi:MAG: CvpA family protein [Candidatus Thioglobus sp.]|uniref:CvpA family protein n=1 Tax=Candidatus Thioglobus sp. TaxID=2026721 RepID=UPI0026156B3E|nr:CvpA family protein [Candidatus Thioglobus sp.]MDC9727054.1 CvpA family protein [Candidatus Thioglobus sp.]
MNEFFANIWNLIGSLVWSDWITLLILIAFLILGFKRGMAKELINLGFLLLAILIAWLFYQSLAVHATVTWLLLSHQSHMAIAFGVIFVGVLLIKKAIYQLTAALSQVSNPCALNKIFAYLVFVLVAIALSWHYLDIIANLGLMEIVVTDTSIRIGLAFIITLAIIVGVCASISNMLNISIDASKPCFLSSLFKKILSGLHLLDEKLNAKNINSNKNNIGGLLVGLFKGSLAILIMVLVFQSIDTISQQNYWNEANGALKTFQDVATDIKPALSEHLLFIENK